MIYLSFNQISIRKLYIHNTLIRGGLKITKKRKYRFRDTQKYC